MILCYEAGAESIYGMSHVPVVALARLIEVYESTAALIEPSEVIGVAVNSSRLSEADAVDEIDQIEQRLQLPACDVYRNGPEKLVDAAIALRDRLSPIRC